MAVNLSGAVVTNRVVWKEDLKSRKKAFASLDLYKKKVMGIKTQLMGLGNIKIKVDGVAKASAQLNQLRAKAAKAGAQPAAKQAGVASSVMGPKRPPVQGSVKREAIARKAVAREEKRIADILRFEQTPAMQAINREDRKNIILGLKKIKNANKLKVAMAESNARLRKEASLQREILRLQNKRNFAQTRMNNSMTQAAGAAFSVFTALQGIGAIAKTGMEMQKVSATMLSVSKDSAEAKDNMSFLRKEAHRLGMDRVKAGRALSKILAARGDLSLGESKKLFTSVSEAGVVSGTSADEMSLQVKALSQMLGKTTVMSKQNWTFN